MHLRSLIIILLDLREPFDLKAIDALDAALADVSKKCSYIGFDEVAGQDGKAAIIIIIIGGDCADSSNI